VSDGGTIRLLAVGDVMLGDSSHFLGRGAGTLVRREGPQRPFAAVASLLAEGDLFFANLESPLSARRGERPWDRVYRAPTAAAAGLVRAACNVMSVANNHIREHGADVLAETHAALAAHGIAAAGYAPTGGDAGGSVTVRCRDVTVSFHCESLVRDIAGPAADPAAAAAALGARLASDTADVRVVSLHWGDEYVDQPSAEQRRLARGLIDAGATLVLGHHPHVLQPVEEYGGGLIAYSLGNFICDQGWSQATRTGGILDVRCGRAGVAGWSFHPTRSVPPAVPVILAGDEAAAVRRRLAPVRDLPAAAYAELRRRRQRAMRLRMKGELLASLPRVGADTWAFLLLRRWRRGRGQR
jgi:poly-gamma-glutamate synthesis protein (capsule biosynthesis protein)